MNEFQAAGNQQQQIAVNAGDLGMVAALPHHQEVAFLVDEVAPAHVALQHQALLGRLNEPFHVIGQAIKGDRSVRYRA